MNVLPPQAFVERILDLMKNPLWGLIALIGFSVLLLAVAGLLKSRREAWQGTHAPLRHRKQLDDLASRWQLFLLGTTGFVLSLASGYTTWVGMTNFTGESTLSLMVTFGIQGVMLIVAWLIGESFASGMNRRLPDGRPVGRLNGFIGIMLAVAVVAVAFYWMLHSSGTIGITRTGGASEINWARFADITAYFALGLIVLAVLAFNFSRGGELSLPYVQSARIIVKNAVLWLMFLACMATSVFFSFDSLFTAIFPKEERVRSAQLRAQNQVAGIVADIGATIETRRLAEIGHLFGNRENGWEKYDKNLTTLLERSQGAEAEIERYFTAQIESRNTAISQQQERIASAQSGTAGLVVKKNTLLDELNRLKGERPALAADHAEKKTELDNRARGVDAKRVEAQAEDRGAEGTLKQGKGPVYRQIMSDLARLQDAYKIQDTRVRDAKQRLDQTDARIAALQRELAAVDGEIAKLKGEAETAAQLIQRRQDSGAGSDQPRVDPARVRPAFERARLEFRQDPTKEKLAALHQQCSQLYGAMVGTPATKDKVRGIDCDPKQASEAAGVMFALNDGLKTFAASCAGGDKLEANKSTDALYGFARKCLADSGLPAKETDELRTKINFLELSRDDKAHPFVATINAFNDGNRLAYLALGIAVAMDLLVFMSGLFGANAVRSPLSDVPSMKARSGRQLEAIVQNALLPDTFDNARAVLNAMRPMTSRDGFSARVLIHDHDPHAADIRRVLNAAATIGAVRHVDSHDEVYEVRSELFEFLSVVAKKAFESDGENARLAELRKVIEVALRPHVGDHADIVLHQCRPISERNGFSAEIYLGRMPADDAFIVQKVLNAGATLSYVQLDERPDQDQRYYVHKQLYKTLLLISSAAHRTGQRSVAPRLAAPDQPAVAQGGSLDGKRSKIEHGERGLLSEFPNDSRSVEFDSHVGSKAVSDPQLARGKRLERDNEAALKGGFWLRLVDSIGLDPMVVGRCVANAEVAELMRASWSVLRSAGVQDNRLKRIISVHEDNIDAALSGEYTLIRQENNGDEYLNSLLYQIDDEIKEVLPIIHMLPRNGIVSYLVDELEREASELNASESKLLASLSSLQAEFSDVSAIDDVQLWRRVKEALVASLPGANNVRPFGPRASNG